MSDQKSTHNDKPDDVGFKRMNASEESSGYPDRGNKCNAEGWWHDRSLLQKIVIGIGFGILGIGFLALLGLVVMLLWNWLMPDIFGLKRLTYWQAWGLLILCHILFKGFGSSHNGVRSDRKRRRHLRRYMQEDQATIEDADESK